MFNIQTTGKNWLNIKMRNTQKNKRISGANDIINTGFKKSPRKSISAMYYDQGGDFNNLKNIIGEISKEVYEEFDSRRL